MPREEIHSKLIGSPMYYNTTSTQHKNTEIDNIFSINCVTSGQWTGNACPDYKENIQFQNLHISLSKLKPLVAWKDLITFNCHKSFLPYNTKVAGTAHMYLHKLIQLSKIIHLVKRTHY